MTLPNMIILYHFLYVS